MTQTELADLAGTSRTTITNLELGNQQAPLHLLLTIADVLAIELREFIPSRVEISKDDSTEKIPLNVAGVLQFLPPKAARAIHAHSRPRSVEPEGPTE